MSVFLPYIQLGLFLAAIITVSYLFGYIRSILIGRVVAWTLIVVSLVSVEIITREATSLFRMIAIVTVTLFSMKSIVLVETYKGAMKLKFKQWVAFSSGWFGMRPIIFEKLQSASLNDVSRLLIKGITRVFFGSILLVIASFVFQNYKVYYFVPALLSLLGLSFVLHFGLLNISTALWRYMGVDCKELFKSPGLSMSLKEFWGKRWNMAFSEMTALVVYKPVKSSTNQIIAIFCAFLFSGLLHEIAISLPVRSGYGLPLLYFLIHGMLMQIEDKIGVIKSILSNKIAARIWILFWLIVPMPLLFHKEFIIKIVFPLINTLVPAF